MVARAPDMRDRRHHLGHAGQHSNLARFTKRGGSYGGSADGDRAGRAPAHAGVPGRGEQRAHDSPGCDPVRPVGDLADMYRYHGLDAHAIVAADLVD